MIVKRPKTLVQATRIKPPKKPSAIRLLCEGLVVGLLFWGFLGAIALYKLG